MAEFIDIDALLKPVSDQKPCGDDPEYLPEYAALAEFVKGKPDRIGRGKDAEGKEIDIVDPGEEPHWPDVESQCRALLEKSKHLTPMLWLTLALMRQHGVGGLRDGLELVSRALDTYWDAIYPLMEDPGDDIRTFRFRDLSPESDGGEGELKFPSRMKDLLYAGRTRLGPLSLRDYLIVKGLAQPEAGKSPVFPDDATIEAALGEAGPETLSALLSAAEACLDHLKSIRLTMQQKGAPQIAPNFDRITGLLEHYRKPLMKALGSSVTQGEAAAASGEGVSAGSVPAASGAIHTAADVRRTIEALLVYYKSHDRSSPVPLLLSRALRLVDKSFVEAVRDLTPEAIKELEHLSGETFTA